jgi:1-deoxy-D-xylulose-5-phosphate synthase
VGGGRVAAHEIMVGVPAIRNLIREDKVAQMYSAIQTGQNIGMQTLDQNLKQLLQQGNRIAILLFGSLLQTTTTVADRLNATLINMRFVKTLDEALLITIAQEYDIIVTIEDNAIGGGAGSAVNEFLLKHNFDIAILNLGIPDSYLEHATREQQLELIGLDADGISNSINVFEQSLNASQLVQTHGVRLAS